MPHNIATALAAGATVLTGNQRAARILRQSVDRQNRLNGLLSWSPPPILAWSTWTASLWRQLLLCGGTSQMLLNRAQEHALWRTVIAADDILDTLKSPESLAQMAAEAWAVLARYRGLGRLKGSATNTDTEAFIRWAAAFDDRCRSGRYLPDPRLESTTPQGSPLRHPQAAPAFEPRSRRLRSPPSRPDSPDRSSQTNRHLHPNRTSRPTTHSPHPRRCRGRKFRTRSSRHLGPRIPYPQPKDTPGDPLSQPPETPPPGRPCLPRDSRPRKPLHRCKSRSPPLRVLLRLPPFRKPHDSHRPRSPLLGHKSAPP